MRFTTTFTMLVCLTTFSCLFANEQVPDTVYVTANGAWYAKCIPDSGYGDREKGKTMVYHAGKDTNTLKFTFDWYSPETLISGWGGGVTVIRFGGRRRGFEAKDAGDPRGYQALTNDVASNLSYEPSINDPEISIYRNWKMVARYSTLDLLGTKEKVSKIDFEDRIIKEYYFVEIFEKKGRDTLTFTPGYGLEIILRDNRRIVFNIYTGGRITLPESAFTRRVH